MKAVRIEVLLDDDVELDDWLDHLGVVEYALDSVVTYPARCAWCGTDLPKPTIGRTGRPRETCSGRCRTRLARSKVI